MSNMVSTMSSISRERSASNSVTGSHTVRRTGSPIVRTDRTVMKFFSWRLAGVLFGHVDPGRRRNHGHQRLERTLFEGRVDRPVILPYLTESAELEPVVFEKIRIGLLGFDL